jgi:hypothetical protein
MAFRNGSQINPALGRTDYSPFVQGALQGASHIARGGEAMGNAWSQGLGSMGQSIGAGIQQYKQNKVIAADATAQFEGAAQANPEILQRINSPEAPPEVAKAFKKLQKDGAVGVKDASALAAFAHSYTKQKQQTQQQEMQRLQMEHLQGQMAQGQKDTEAFAKALGQFLPGNSEAMPKPAKPFSVPALVQEYFKQGGSPAGMDKVDQVIKMMGPQTPGRAPAGYRWKPDGTQEYVPGGPADPANKTNNPPQKYTPGQAYELNGKYIGNAVFDQTTGVWGIGTSDGKVVPIPAGANPATATSFTKDVPSIMEFRKLRDTLTDDEIALKRYTRYLSTVKDASQGVAQLADRFSTAFKTFFDSGQLSPQEVSLAASSGQLQGLLGAARLDVVGGGVMTDQDAARIIARLGGDANAFRNKEVVQRAIAELFEDKYEKYKNAVQFYNSGVKSFYSQHGFSEAEPLKVDEKVFTPEFFKKAEATTAASTANRLDAMQRRIEELKKKQAQK